MRNKKIITVNKISLEQYNKLREAGYQVKVAKEPPRKKATVAQGSPFKAIKLRANGFVDYIERRRRKIIERIRARKISKKLQGEGA